MDIVLAMATLTSNVIVVEDTQEKSVKVSQST